MGRARHAGDRVVRAVVLLLACAGPALADRPIDPERPRGRVERIEHAEASDLPALGPRHAPVTFEVFLNLGDSFASGQLHGLVRELSRRHPRRLRVVYRLTSGSQSANQHILAALEAHAQGHFVELVDAMYEGTLRSPRIDALVELASRVGIDGAAVAEAIDPTTPRAAALAALARANHFYRKRLQVRRLPAVVVNGEVYDKRATSIEELEGLYDQAYGEAMARLGDGVPLEALYAILLDERGRAAAEPAPTTTMLDGLEAGERPPNLRPRLVQLDPSRGEVLGREAAPVAVTLLCNLVTRNCGEAASELDELRAAYPDEVKVVFRHLFDPADHDQEPAERYARAATCAAAEGRFEAFYDHFLVRRGRPAQLDDDGLISLAEEHGLDPPRFRRCLAAAATRAAVAAELAAARREGVVRTPSLVIDGRLYLGARPFDELARAVDRALAAGLFDRLDHRFGVDRPTTP